VSAPATPARRERRAAHSPVNKVPGPLPAPGATSKGAVPVERPVASQPMLTAPFALTRLARLPGASCEWAFPGWWPAASVRSGQAEEAASGGDAESAARAAANELPAAELGFS
jgi:hypothetical protein